MQYIEALKTLQWAREQKYKKLLTIVAGLLCRWWVLSTVSNIH